MIRTSGGTASIGSDPLVSSNTSWPRSSSPAIRGMDAGWSSGSPPVTSTVGIPNAAASSITSPTARTTPPWKVKAESHQVHRRLHPVRRTNTHGLPAWVDSP